MDWNWIRRPLEKTWTFVFSSTGDVTCNWVWIIIYYLSAKERDTCWISSKSENVARHPAEGGQLVPQPRVALLEAAARVQEPEGSEPAMQDVIYIIDDI